MTKLQMIITFVVFFTPDIGNRMSGRGQADYGTLYGQPIKRDDLAQAYTDARIGYFLSPGQWPDRDERARMFGFNLDAEARQRLLVNHQLKQLGVDAGETAVAQEIKNIFTDPQTGAFSLQRYDLMLKQHFAAAGVSEAAFERFLRHDLGRQQLARMFGLAGKLITDRAAEAFPSAGEPAKLATLRCIATGRCNSCACIQRFASCGYLTKRPIMRSARCNAT